MKRLVVAVLTFHAVFCDTFVMKPMYKYRYETEDVMKTAESSIPVHGYHVVEGGYYPMEDVGSYGGGGGYIGGGGGYIGGGGGGGYVGEGYGGHFIPVPIHHGGYGPVVYGGGPVGGGIPLGGVRKLGYGGIGHIGGGGLGVGGLHGGYGGLHGGHGGQEIEKAIYSEGKKNIDDGRFEKAYGKKGDEFNQGEQGYSKGQVAVKDAKGDSGYYSNHEGGKKVYEDGKEYHGGQHFDKQGKQFYFHS